MSSALSSLESKASASGSPVSQRVWLVMPAILPEPRQTAARTFAWLLVHHVVSARLQSSTSCEVISLPPCRRSSVKNNLPQSVH
jgi:hypothetical protein